jgi:hypothetical protein
MWSRIGRAPPCRSEAIFQLSWNVQNVDASEQNARRQPFQDCSPCCRYQDLALIDAGDDLQPDLQKESVTDKCLFLGPGSQNTSDQHLGRFRDPAGHLNDPIEGPASLKGQVPSYR